MKRIIIILIVVFALLVGALFAIPVFFKKSLLNVAKTTLNQQLNAEVELADLKISLFKSFPKVSVELEDMLLKGSKPFENDTLVSVPAMRTTIDLASLFNPSELTIEEIVLTDAVINLKSSESGETNWNLGAVEDSPTVSDENMVAQNEFQLKLDKIEIRNGNLRYNDQAAKMVVTLDDIDFDISGEMYGSSTDLETNGKVNNLEFNYGGVKYVSNTSLDIKTLLNADFDRMRFTIAENELLVNRLPLQLNGIFEMPSDTVLVDMEIRTKDSDFENFLALVPPVYEEYMKDIKTSGSATIQGTVSGFYADENYPAFDVSLNIENGTLKYADLPENVNNISSKVWVNKPQGDLDLTKIEITETHAEIKNNPVDLKLNVSTPVSDPYFEGVMVGKVNLSDVKDALPIDSVDMSGIINANLVAKGKFSAIEKEAYDEIKSDGIVVLKDFVFGSPELKQNIVVPKGTLDFSPKSINLRELSMKVGQSDFNLMGSLNGYLNYFLKKGQLTGNLRLNSKLVNLNELMTIQRSEPVTDVSEEDTEEKDEEVLAFDVPKDIDITFNSNIETAVLDRIPIKKINGEIRAKDEKLILKNLNMDMLDGKLQVNGSYQNTPKNMPLFDFGLDISSFNIPVMYQTITGFRQIMPVARNSTGTFSSNFGLKGRLSPQLKLIPSTANGDGSVSTKNLHIKDSPVLNQLSGILSKEKLKDVQIDDFIAKVNIDNGNLLLKPFKTRVIGQETTVAGTLNAESLLDMRLDFNVEREAFGPDIQKILAVIPGNEKIKMLPAGVVINGPVGKPKVNADLSKTTKAVADATKDDVKKSLDKLGKNILKFLEK